MLEESRALHYHLLWTPHAYWLLPESSCSQFVGFSCQPASRKTALSVWAPPQGAYTPRAVQRVAGRLAVGKKTHTHWEQLETVSSTRVTFNEGGGVALWGRILKSIQVQLNWSWVVWAKMVKMIKFLFFAQKVSSGMGASHPKFLGG